MDEPLDIELLIQACRDMARWRFGLELSDAEVAGVLEPILFEPKDILPALTAGIITRWEAAGAIADRFSYWCASRLDDGAKFYPDPERAVEQVERALAATFASDPT